MSGRSTFHRVMENSFIDLPATLQRIHDTRSKLLRGRCAVERGSHWLVKWLAPLASLPTASTDAPLSVAIDVIDHSETWTRNFNGHCMQSRLWAEDKLLAERLGAITLLFTLHNDQGRIRWRVAGARLLGVPLPASWFAGADASEEMLAGRYVFDVRATLPLVGLLVHYRGWLAEHE